MHVLIKLQTVSIWKDSDQIMLMGVQIWAAQFFKQDDRYSIRATLRVNGYILNGNEDIMIKELKIRVIHGN